MINQKQDEINLIINKLLKNVNANEKPPIILSPKDLDMIIDYTYYSLKMKMNISKNSLYQINLAEQNNKKSQISSPSEITQNNLIEVKPTSSEININDNDLDNYIKQAEKYILTINRKTIDSLEKEQQLNINELLSQISNIQNNNNNIDENNLLALNNNNIQNFFLLIL